MRNKKVIFIDLDGTVLDVSERTYQVYKRILQKYNKKFLSKKEYLKLKKEKSPVKKILKRTEAKDILLRFEKEWKEKIEDPHFLDLDKISLSMRKTLLYLKSKYKLVLVTLRNHPKRLTTQLRKKKIDKMFDKILVKPAGDHRLKWKLKYSLIKRYGNYTKDSIIIGDTETDVLTGKRLGIKTMAVTGGARNREFLRKCKPEFLIKNVAEIKKYAKKI